MSNRVLSVFVAAVIVLSLVQRSFSYSCSELPSGSSLCHLDVTEDVFVYNSQNQNNYDFLIAGIHPQYPLKRTLLKFEDIPSSCQEIAMARMYVYYWYAHKASFMTEEQVPWIPRPVQARQVLKRWRELEVTRDVRFNSQGIVDARWDEPYLGLNDTDAKAYIDDTYTFSRNMHAGYKMWNITTTAKNWLVGQPNHGILLSVSNEDQLGREIRFFSRERSHFLAPYLEILCTPISEAVVTTETSVTNTTGDPDVRVTDVSASEAVVTTETIVTNTTGDPDATDVSASEAVVTTETSITDTADMHVTDAVPAGTAMTGNCTVSGSNTLCRLNVTEDVFIYDDYNTNNEFDFLIVGLFPGFPLKRTLLKFEDIPSSCQEVVKARMYVYYWYAHEPNLPYPGPIQARQILKSWKENEATRDVRFANAPWSEPYLGLNNTDAKLHVDGAQTFFGNSSAGYKMWDITTAAKNWLAGEPNYGILLSDADEDPSTREIRFFGREHSSSQAPYMEVVCDTSNAETSNVDTKIGTDGNGEPHFSPISGAGEVRYFGITSGAITTSRYSHMHTMCIAILFITLTLC